MLRDPESLEERLVDTSNKAVQDLFESTAIKNQENVINTFRKYGIGHIALDTSRPFIDDLKLYFTKKVGRPHRLS